MASGITAKLAHLYETRYKQLLLIPVIIFIFGLVVVSTHYVQHGEFVSKGVSLKGGTTLSIDKNIDANSLKLALEQKFPHADINTRIVSALGSSSSVVVEASDITPDDLLAAVEETTGPLDKSEYGIETTGPSLGQSFFRQAMISVIVAFVLMSLVVYLYFRAALPSFYAIFSVVADALLALTMFDLFGLRLTTAGVAAFLMLIGYSIDTDILLTTRVLKRHEGTVSERMAHALPTGLTMTFAAIAAVVVGYYATPADTLKQIMFILFWGLIGDVIFTWLFNATLLRMYVERKEAHKGEQHGA